MSHEAKEVTWFEKRCTFPQVELWNKYDMQFNSQHQFKCNFKIYSSTVLRPNAGHDLLISEDCRSHITKHCSCKTALVEWSARWKNLYLTTHNIHNRKISMPPEGFESTFSTGERPQTYTVDRAVFERGRMKTYGTLFIVNIRHEF
jgi:hypothetical protein